MAFPRRTARARRLGFEQLERREVFAGNVAAVQWGATLYLTGDGAANALQISTGGAPNRFLITGFSTTIAGAATKTYSNVTSFVIDMGGGADEITVGNFSLPALNIAGNVNIVGGTGGDSIFVNANIAGALAIDGGANDDEIFVHRQVAGSVTIGGGTGGDAIFVGAASQNATVGGNLTITGGEGHDTSVVHATIGYALSIDGQGGDDLVEVKTSTVGASATISGGIGHDRLFFGQGFSVTPNSVKGNLTINGGEGNEFITVSGAISYYLVVNGDGGHDDIRVQAANVGVGAYLYGGLGNDGIAASSSTFPVLYISGSFGADTINLFLLTVSVWTWLDGGPDNDLYNHGVNSLGALYQYNIETTVLINT